MFQRFIDALAQAFPDSLTILLLDHSGAHTAHGLPWPAHGRDGRWPPDGPALSPIARIGRDVKDDVAWRPFPDGDAPQHEVGDW